MSAMTPLKMYACKQKRARGLPEGRTDLLDN